MFSVSLNGECSDIGNSIDCLGETGVVSGGTRSSSVGSQGLRWVAEG